MVRLQVAARVGDQREARRVRLRESIEGERGDGFHDLVPRRGADAPRLHSRPQPRLDRAHPLHGALEPHGAAQLLRLAAREARRDHGDAQQLLLEERHAERAREDRLEAGVRVLDRRPPLPALEEGAHHAAHDRARADDRDLHDEVVELRRSVARQRRHLRAALDLEAADRVGGVQHPVDAGIVRRQVRQVHLRLLVRADHRDRLFERCEHAETEQVHLDDPEVGAVVLVPLHDDAARHRRGLERHDLVEASRRHDHSARVLPEVARQVLDLQEEAQEVPRADVLADPGPPRRLPCRALRSAP